MVGIHGYGQYSSYRPVAGSIAARALATQSYSTTQAIASDAAGSAKPAAAVGAAATRLSPGTLGSLLSQQETGATSWNDGPKEPPPAPPGEAQVWGIGYFLSSADKEMVKSATGFSINADGMPCDDDGNPVECPANDFIGQIALEREGGALTGAITPGYLRNLFDRFSGHGEPLNPEWLTKSLDYLAKRNGD